MLDQLQGLHIEPTNMCTLKCPRCSRTEFIETFKPKDWDNQNLNLDHLKQFLDIDLTGLTIGLNGNYGDPIYYPNLFEMIEFFKSNQSRIILHTNGSYRPVSWWEKLAGMLDKNDVVTFSIDGTPENFTNYRVNADWTSIQQGIDVLVKSQAHIVWKYIVFSFNENHIDEARQLSQQLGMDEFVVNNSDRWRENDWLQPTKRATINDTIIKKSGAFDGNRNESLIQWKKFNKRDIDIAPRCKQTNGMHFISADGFYMPCCYSGDHRFYYKTKFYKNQDMYDISKTTITEVLDHLTDFYSTLEDAKLNYCTFNCPKL